MADETRLMRMLKVIMYTSFALLAVAAVIGLIAAALGMAGLDVS